MSQQPASPAEKSELSTSGYRSLLSAASIAVELGRTGVAERMARNLTLLRPDLPQAQSLQTMCDIFQGRHGMGLQRLRKAVEDFPDYQMGIVLLAMSMKSENVSGWQAMLEEVIEDGRDEYAIGLAYSALGRELPEGLADLVSGATTQVAPAAPTAPGAFWV